MSGLSPSYISNALSAEGIDATTRALLLNFLNTATSAAAIAGIEPSEGPVVDDTTRGYGDQVRDYDIGVDVAQRILAKRNSLGGTFTDLTQLAYIDYFGPDKFNDLIKSFIRTVYEISSITFDWNTASVSNDALTIRRNFTTAAPNPSWQKGMGTTYAESPVAYAINETQGQILGIRVALRANGLAGAFIRAIGGGVLGSVKEQFVSFDALGYSGNQTFQLEAASFHAWGVGVHDVTWRWQWRQRPADPWRDIVITRHRLYVVLNAPTLPWVQTPGSTSLPWTDALEITCRWASGAADKDTAASRIAERYNASGRVSYDTISGATMYGWSTYNLTEMIERLNGGIGLGEKVNCTDSANTVSTLANLLGCDLWQSRMGWSFALNPVIAIGYGVWAVPFGFGFSYHEVAWKGACTASDALFDGCLKVDADADPTTAPHTPLLPTNIRFGDCATLEYRLRLCPPTANGCAQCQPQPATTRQRRPIQ